MARRLYARFQLHLDFLEGSFSVNEFVRRDGLARVFKSKVPSSIFEFRILDLPVHNAAG